jgi:hypothetical protein
VTRSWTIPGAAAWANRGALANGKAVDHGGVKGEKKTRYVAPEKPEQSIEPAEPS